MISPIGSTTTPLSTGAEVSSPQMDKLRKGAREFESMMVEQIWKGMKSESEDSGSGQSLSDMASHAFAVGVAARGGFGIAKMILHQLNPSPPAGTKELKPADLSADHHIGDKQ
jgi:Rod binding domain-containing protein